MLASQFLIHDCREIIPDCHEVSFQDERRKAEEEQEKDLMPQRLSFQRLYFQTELKRQSLIGQSFVSVLPFYLGGNIEAVPGAKRTHAVYSS